MTMRNGASFAERTAVGKVSRSLCHAAALGIKYACQGLPPLRAELTSSKIIPALGIFWIFAALMAALAGVTLVCSGTPLDKIWALNKPAYAVLLPIAGVVGPLFLVFS